MTADHESRGPSRRDGHLSDLDLERLAYEPRERTEALAAHLEACEACMSRQVRHDTHRLAHEPVPIDFSLVHPLGAQAPRRGSSGPLWGAVALAAAALLVAGVISGGPPTHGPPDFRAKGAAIDLEIFVHDGHDVRRAGPDGAVHPGERLGFRVTPRRDGHIIVVGFDAHGPYPCWPPGEAGAQLVTATGEALDLDAAVQLDQRLGRERIVALLCDAPVGFAEAAARVADGPARGACVSDELVLTKVRQ